MMPPELNDGYSSFVHGYIVRCLTADDIARARMLAEGDESALDEWLFSEPRVFVCTGEGLSPEMKMDFLRVACTGYDYEKVREDINFMKEHPELSGRPCDMCRKWWYSHSTGKIVDRGDGQPLERHAASPPACETDAGCAKGHWSNPYQIAMATRRAMAHYREFKAVGCPFPLDGVMRKNWSLFSEAGL